ncbi:flagellar FliJ family protein [Nocardioides KLBMP 9356]|uniref:Flagellar FliJ protein n=1 Tax=Nocardioides potassii TaxID=2911371 RepID=A0ABS9HD55_9ACTN|nr:flagellar FliJ family protein [Nocardioides potassii]MCF6378237.1 flagellar FliJ family protein [Nocardioides potassii]
MARTSDHDPDAGMNAVARVRGVREQDSRLGLSRAAADEREADRRLHATSAQLAASRDPEQCDAATFASARTFAAGLALEVSASRAALATAETVTVAAREHWQHDRTRLAAVELLLERRAEQRRAERARRERVEVDDLTAARWLRGRPAAPTTGGTP